jgi:hypothetical protein
MSTNPNTAYSNEASKDDRLEALRNDRAQHQPRPTGGQTYLSRAVSEAGRELGRYAHLSEVTIVGSRSPQPTTYHAMQREPEQQLVLDQSADGHSALALQAERGRRIPIYPAQPAGSPWAAPDPSGEEPPFPVDISVVKDTSKVNP